ncbi:MAG: aminodeoxychorismate synthase component I [Planctomycetota bacterium]
MLEQTEAEASIAIHELAPEIPPERAFAALQHLPHCIWFDSASDRDSQRGRFSFVTADPVNWLSAELGDENPWPTLHAWCQQLPSLSSLRTEAPDLPPFLGGIAGVIGYEAGWWLEPTLRESCNWSEAMVRQTQAMAVGVYDAVIAFDHHASRVWLVANGLQRDWTRSTEASHERVRTWQSFLANARPTEPRQQAPCHATSVQSNFDDNSYSLAVADIVQRICRGDSFQVNLAQTLTTDVDLTAVELYHRLRSGNPAPYAGYLDAGDYQILSSSPEGFLQVRDREVITRPIKGTQPRGEDTASDHQLAEYLQASEKDRAENTMIVDLMRNDLSKVCQDTSIEVTGLCEIERYQRVQHLVSTVRGRLREEASVVDLLCAAFPGGSITGAPKVEAMKTIQTLEGQPRGAYCGSMGYLSCCGSADWNILIRTISKRGRQLSFPVGGGITARSDPASETAETWHKAAGLLDAIGVVRGSDGDHR